MVRPGRSHGGRRSRRPIPARTPSVLTTLVLQKSTHTVSGRTGLHGTAHFRSRNSPVHNGGRCVTRGKNEELVVRERPRDSRPSSRQVDAGQTDARPYRHRDEPILPAGGQAQVQHVLRRTALVPAQKVRMRTRVAAAVNSRRSHPSRSFHPTNARG